MLLGSTEGHGHVIMQRAERGSKCLAADYLVAWAFQIMLIQSNLEILVCFFKGYSKGVHESMVILNDNLPSLRKSVLVEVMSCEPTNDYDDHYICPAEKRSRFVGNGKNLHDASVYAIEIARSVLCSED